MNLSRWEDVKAEAHRRHPEMASPERRAAAKAAVDAYVGGHHLAQLRKMLGKTQAEVAATIGVPRARVAQIERGRVQPLGIETLRSYAAALGGDVEVVVRVGPHRVNVACEPPPPAPQLREAR